MMASHILIVEDEVQLLRVLAQVLTQRLEHVSVDTCDSPESALERIRCIDYDAILTDVRMPGVDGLTLLRAIRELRADTPTLLMTGHAEHDLAVEALRAGAFDYLEKPIDINYLVASLSRALRMRHMDRELDEKRAALERNAAELANIVEDQTRQLREANRIKDEFLATLSHELRTPLTAILGWSRLMLRDELDEATANQAMAAIERNATLQARLIDDLLDVSRIMTGKLRLAKRRVALAPILMQTLEAVSNDARAKRVRFHRNIDAMVGEVNADPDRMAQIALNLLSNALKFAPDGNVDVVLARDGSDAVLVVRDSGVGIAPDFLPHVFDRFRQADTSLSRARGGLGLGLAIVHHLVLQHGGTVSAESPGQGKGATFTVRLPVLETATETLEQPRIASTPGREPALSGVRVLVVEDEQDTRTMVQVALERFGALVTAVGSAAQAFDALERAHPDVMVCDIAMPHEDGYSLIRRIRARDEDHGGRIPAAALTAHAHAEDVRRALSEGFDVHLSKPVEPAVVADAVSHLAEIASARRACAASLR